MPGSEDGAATAYEQAHVHRVYEHIADHFAATRYKPWPLVERFLKALPPAAVGLDLGCGNGKYLACNADVFVIASDRSRRLVGIAADGLRAMSAGAAAAAADVLVADALAVPVVPRRLDFVISIAVVHHLATRARRVAAIAAMLELLRRRDATSESSLATPSETTSESPSESPPGRALVYVWALEQRSSRRGWDEGHSQDVMVPWVTQPQSGQSPLETLHRYYHLYRQGELEADVVSAGGRVLQSGYEKDNWWAVAAPAVD